MNLKDHRPSLDVPKMPALPEVFTQINDMVNNPRASLADIGPIIEQDVGLTALLLKIVNSAFYSFPSPIDTLSRAVTIVGTQQLADLVLATSIIKVFHGISQDLLDLESFWRHSVACGIAARILATLRRDGNGERLFVAGILHDIGRLLICVQKGDQANEILTRFLGGREPMCQIEVELLGYDHSTVGGTLVQDWNLPASLQEAVAYHHNPLAANQHPVEAAIVHVADTLTHAMQLGNSGAPFVPPFEPKAWDQLGLPISALSFAMEQIDRQYQDTVQMVLPEPLC